MSIHSEEIAKISFSLCKSDKEREQWKKSHPSFGAEKWERSHEVSMERYRRAYYLLNTFGISVEEWDRVLINQSGRCALCSKEMNGRTEPAVDLDRETRRMRGLLCSCCKNGVSAFKDSIEVLKKAIEYLSQS
jgi:hypothetical protein